MGFDLVGFEEATPGTGTPNLAVALGENLYTVVNTDWILVKHPYLLMVQYAAVSTPGQAIVDMPELKPWYSFIKAADLNDVDPQQGLSSFAGRPLPLWDILGGKGFKAGAQLRCMTRNGTDEENLIGLWMGDGRITQAMLDSVNPTHTLRGYSDTDQVALTWTTLSMVWDNVLPEGEYAVVGMRCAAYKSSGPEHGLARLIFQTAPSAGFRPGVPMALMEADSIEYMSTNDWPTFPWKWPLLNVNRFLHTQIPNVEVLSGIANTDHLVELELEKVA